MTDSGPGTAGAGAPARPDPAGAAIVAVPGLGLSAAVPRNFLDLLPPAVGWLSTAVRERPGQVPRLLHDYSRTGLGSMVRGMDTFRRHDIRPGVTGAGVPV